MSLINEALRRAEQQKRIGGGKPVPTSARGPVAPPSRWTDEPIVDAPTRRPRGGMRGATVLSACLILGLAAVLYMAQIPITEDPSTPQPTFRDSHPPVENATDAPFVAAPAAPVADAISVPTHVALTAIKPVLPTSAPPSDTVEPVPTIPVGMTGVVADASVASQAPLTPLTVIRPKPLNPDEFKLGAILQTGDVIHAIVNNHLVATGEDIDGAKVVDIGKYHVVLEKDGQRVTLRL